MGVALAAQDELAAKPAAAAIASAHPLATQAGMEILASGGNAFDAAVAVSAALAVVEPYSSGLGGGGFWLLHRASDGHEVMVDGRERAPLAAHRDLYLDEQGEVVRDGSMNGPLSAAIPGEPAALDHIARHYGKLPLARSLAPAIRLAREGFAVDEHYRRMAGFRLEVMARYPETASILLDHGAVPEAGDRIVQEDLADTLEVLAGQGAAGFYRGPVAQRLVEGVRAAGGIWTLDDLERYRVVERAPVRFQYRDLQVTTAAPPSSGGVALATMLHILEGYDLEALDEATRTHLVIEAMRRAYRDRAEYLGDPDFVAMPLARLTSPDYAAGLRAAIRADRATPSADLPGESETGGGHHTSHFSILDREGNRVAATLSINYPFGSGFIAPGTGVLLNDEMDDFSAKPGVPNAYGLVGAEANSIAPGKRPLSSMSPTFVESTDRVAILGTPGGSRIITMVLLGILEFARGTEPADWVARPRFHHQFLPDRVEYENEALSEDLMEALQARGHILQSVSSPYGNMQAVLWDRRRGTVKAAADPRGLGKAEVQ
jgi:gamma-glutamyltranspeptidase/glutathione hydrolase